MNPFTPRLSFHHFWMFYHLIFEWLSSNLISRRCTAEWNLPRIPSRWHEEIQICIPFLGLCSEQDLPQASVAIETWWAQHFSVIRVFHCQWTYRWLLHVLPGSLRARKQTTWGLTISPMRQHRSFVFVRCKSIVLAPDLHCVGTDKAQAHGANSAPCPSLHY